MVTLQPRLSLRVSQKQILTPGLVQMVSVLALNKLELRDMINAEMVENPVLEELESTVPMLDDVSRREEERDRQAAEEIRAPEAEAKPESETKDPFDEIDFGAYFQEYLDPGYRSRQEREDVERPSFENFLSRPATLTDHLMWQLASMHLRPEVEEAAELIIGNLNEDGYLTATDDELLGLAPGDPEETPSPAARELVENEAQALGIGIDATAPETQQPPEAGDGSATGPADEMDEAAEVARHPNGSDAELPQRARVLAMPSPVGFDSPTLKEALEIIRQMDPVGVACRTLQECLLTQVKHHQQVEEDLDGEEGPNRQLLADCALLVSAHLRELQRKEYRELSRTLSRPLEAVLQAVEYVKRLDPRPGLRYNAIQPRLIEPDVAIVKQGDEYLVMMNDEDLPQLRLNPAYRKLLHREAAEKEVRSYVKERYKSAIQLIKNIEQRKQTILKVCYAIIQRQREFLDFGIDQLKPMMIKEVAEEIGVHPSTVSRAVANKYAHTAQGVFELRYFFSESVNGPEGGATSLLILKRRVKKLIEEEDASRPLTDEQITRILQSQGIQVTRRTVAKYREDMRIPSTHQRRIKN